MKINKSILAAALGLSVVSASQAGTVYITGSTAFRSQVYNALNTANVVFDSVGATNKTFYDGSSASRANYMIFIGTLKGGSGVTTIQCHWSGSEGGFNDVAANPQVPATFAAVADNVNHGLGLPGSFISHVSELAFTDNVQDYAAIFANNLTPPPALATGAPVGVFTFKWVRNPGLWDGTNVTSAMVRQVLGGFCKRSALTGVAGQNDYVYASGRNSDSGTRVNAFGESGYGIFNPPTQIKITGGVMQDLDGFGTYAGDYGYSSGGTLAGTMGGNTTASSDLWNGGTGFSVIGYMSTSDAATAVTAGAKELTYNGVPFSSQNVKEGAYTCFGNIYLYQANSAGSEAQAAYANLIAPTGVPATLDGITGIKLTDMNCSKQNPVADPVHN